MKTVIVKVHSANNTTQEIAIATKDGQPNTIKAGKYVNYEFFDTSIDRAPNHIITKRVDNHLHVSFEREGQEVDLIIEDFYDNDDQALIGIAEDGTYYHYIPDTGQVSDYVTQLEAGNIEGQALGGEEMVAPWWVTAPAGFPWWLGLGLIPLPFIKDSKDSDPIDPVNDVEANPEVESIAEDTVLTGNVITNDSDEKGATLTVQSATVDVDGTGTPVALVLGTATTLTATDGSAIGELALNADGSYRFDPAPNFHGTVPTVNYTVTDPDGNTDETTLDITVDPVNDAPVAVNDSGTGMTGNAVVVTVVGNDTDAEGDLDPTSVVITQSPAGSTIADDGKSVDVPGEGSWVVDATTGDITFTPATGFTGDPTPISYTVDDRTGETSNEATVTIDYPQTAPITLTMTAPPVFVEDATAAGDVVTTVDTVNDPDGADYRYSIDDSVNYAIDAATGTVTLTQAGADLVNAGTDLPAFNVTAKSTTGQTSVSTPVEIDPIVQKTELKVALITSDEVIEGNPLIHEITLNNTPTSDTTVNVKLSDGIAAGLIGSATLGTDTMTPVQVSTDNGSSWTTVNVVDGKFDVELSSGIDAFKVKIPTVNDWSFEDKESINIEASIGTQTPVSATGIIKDFAWARVSEEGLPTGNVDEAGATSASDQTNSTTDSISLDFDANSTVTSIDYVGDLVQSGGKDISWAWDAGSSTLIGSNDNGKILDITLDSDQNYQVELHQAMDHPLSGEDVLDLKFKATDSKSNTGYFNVAVEDDSPTSTTTNLETGIKEFNELKTNITIVLDVSGSTGYYNILENEKLAATRLIEEYELLGKVQVNLISFEYSATDYGWLDSADAKGAINDLTPSGGTNYAAAIKGVMYDDQGNFDTSMPEANQSVFYFLSDGEAAAGNLSEEVDDWKTYSHDNFDEVHAIGVGPNVSAAGNEFGSLNEISNPNNGIENGNVPLIITVIDELTDGVLNTISTVSEIVYPATYIKDIGGPLDFSIGADNIDDVYSFAWDISNIVYTAAADINWSLDPSNDLVLIGTDATDNHTVIKVGVKDIASSEPRYNISEVDSTAKITSLSLPFLVTDSDQDTSQSSLNIQMDTLPEIKEIRADNGPYQEGGYIDFQVVFDKETSSPSKIKVSLNQTNAESSDDADVSGLEAKINGVWTPLEVINGRATFDVASGTSVLEMRTQAVNDGVNEATETVRISAWTVFNAKDDLYSKIVEIAGDAGLDAIKQIADNSALEATFRNYNSPSYNITDSLSVNLSSPLPSSVTIRYYDANTEIQPGFNYIATGNVIRAELEYTDSQGVLHTFCVNGAVVAEGNNQSSTIDINTTNYTPLVLDLDNDGIETVHISQGVTFDIDADGDQDKTGWVDKDDGLLVRDINHDGLINDARELFGDSTIKQDGSIATDGFDALADLDSNGDGIINADDDAFSQLQVWQDANTDGITQSGELLSLVDADVSEISLDTYKTLTENNGNLVELEGLYTNLDGETRDIHDVLFMYEENQNEALTSNSDLQLSDVLQSDTLDGSLGLAAQSQPDDTDKPASSVDAAISATAVDIATISTDIYLATPTTDYII